MNSLSPEQIADLCNDLDGIANIKTINKLYREQDESHLFPIRNSFNVTERAIKQARKIQNDSDYVYGIEYSYLLDQLMYEIVNNENNW